MAAQIHIGNTALADPVSSAKEIPTTAEAGVFRILNGGLGESGVHVDINLIIEI
jgi:hypothetical protein